jgi:hypothetical protein
MTRPTHVLPPGEIRRLIQNQKAEHTPHAFRAGGSAMADFRRLASVFAALEPAELSGWLDGIEQMSESHRRCLPCSAKIRSYLLIFSFGRLPERQARYERELRPLLEQGRQIGRDYWGEVIASLEGNDTTPAAAAHLAWWRELAAELGEARSLGLKNPLLN